jgi:hypothetical protein
VGEMFMDMNFMRDYYRMRYFQDCMPMLIEREEYDKKSEIRYQMEEAFKVRLEEYSSKLYPEFEKLVDCIEDVHNVMLEEIYLIGARDRENMLR